MGQKSQELKGGNFASWLYQRVIAWQPPSMNSSSTPSKKEEPQLHVEYLHLNKFMYSSV